MAQNAGRPSKGKKRGFGRAKTTLGAIVALALFAAGSWFGCNGLGLGTGSTLGLGGDDATKAISTNAEPADSESETSDSDGERVIAIVVDENTITYDDEEITLEALKERLLSDYVEGEVSYVLKGDQAIKEPYDDVKALLDEQGVDYTIE